MAPEPTRPIYQIEFAPSAAKELANLPRNAQQRIAVKIEALGHAPRPPGCKKLSGEKDLYRIRVGAYRVIYAIHDQRLIVLVLDIGDRKDIYRLRR